MYLRAGYTMADMEVCAIYTQNRYPHEASKATVLDVGGFLRYKRRSVSDYAEGNMKEACGQTGNWCQGGDEFVVPYAPWGLLWTKTHLNVEVAATVNVIGYLYKCDVRPLHRAMYECVGTGVHM